MQINLTLIGQMITFGIFIWFTMKYIWPPLIKAIHDRQARIAEGLSAADKGQKELELAKHRSVKLLQEAKLEASQLIEKANKRSNEILEEAKEKSRIESQNIIENAKKDVAQMQAQAKEVLRQDVVNLSVLGAQKILEREVDATAHSQMLKTLSEQL
ncbi:MAG: F0F1 ATP synthase subunit B [Gammaproteobacteria bacterium CG11_big_fil_rev_8_21_14_0_20_46_22]|nr:MAG: F0F1 ATP synthase subunit B [Gammaproteobacteria bacterium CG12_big_fil_rev_8_21_14_0_65_46_12]PIR11007.1 MAG: F0F1 ATP synthase subunit B [Gammaproteobacteria bacterium CG11_big_fil_rev_8_21_14_0_20_46_22]